ncbi:MAG: class I SAM-dependent methyltransferase family protein [Nitrososphaerota archaeon]|nr:class I SAM-dependent methyltransferase family protein [Aigarchaeota archaeon]MDW8077113.1 class I SAM-dependent methyltransferase family protein [Nitrososphaerota archaeon]
MLALRRTSLREFLKLRFPQADPRALPKKAKIIGHVALVRFQDEGIDLKELGKAITEFYPTVKTVLRLQGITGKLRRPVVELIYGDPNTETVYKEYGYKFMLDVSKLMLCLGNSYERLRTARSVSPGEVVIDMFAGIGQFSIPCAVISKPSRVYAIEINEEAYRYLKINIALNDVEHIVKPKLGDCKELTPTLGRVADRIIMGYFGGTIEALPAALSAVKTEGSVIHFHELVKRGTGKDELWKEISDLCLRMGYATTLIGSRVVKSYSATREHVVIDFKVKPIDDSSTGISQ